MYLALLRTLPNGQIAELVHRDYSRIDISNKFIERDQGKFTNATEIRFPEASSEWPIISHAAIVESSDAEISVKYRAPVTTLRKIGCGDQLVFAPGNIWLSDFDLTSTHIVPTGAK